MRNTLYSLFLDKWINKFMRKIYLALSLFVFALAFGQSPADRDATFNQSTLPMNHYFVNDNVLRSTVLPDGKILVMESDKLYKLDGNLLDNSFSTGSGFAYPGGSIYLNDFAVQDDGKIFVVGEFSSFNGQAVKSVVRLNSDGSLDTSFNYVVSGSPPLFVDAIAKPDGKLLLVLDTKVIRLNSNGSVDSSFSHLSSYYRLKRGVLQPDGKLVLVGCLTYPNIGGVVRLNTNGTIDSSFTASSIVCTGPLAIYAPEVLNNIILLQNGKFMVSGDFDTCNGSPAKNLVKLNADGTFDSSFATSNYVLTGSSTGNIPSISSILEQPDGKLIVGGEFTSCNSLANTARIIRLTANGTVDQTFAGVESFLNITNIYSLSFFNDGKILASGNIWTNNRKSDNFIVKLNADGTKDNSFNNTCIGFFYNTVNKVIGTADGKLLVGGSFHLYNDSKVNLFARLTNDGTLDTSLNYGGLEGFPDNDANIQAIAERPDGKIYVAARNFTSFNGQTLPSSSIIRLNPDGTRDTTFNISNGLNYQQANAASVYDLLVRPDGGVIVAGNINRVGSTTVSHLVHLSPTGSFLFGSSSYPATCLRLQSDGKLLVASQGGLKRYNSNFTFTDNTFSYTPSVKVTKIEIQPDGKIIVCRPFTPDGISTISLERITSTGSVDPSFNYTGQNAFNLVTDFGLLPDGKILIFKTSINPATYQLLRLNSDGSVDDTFPTQSFDNENIKITVIAGKPYLHGQLKYYQNSQANGLIRLNGDTYYHIIGQNKFDSNSNGCDAGDAGFGNLKLSVSGNPNLNEYITGAGGNYNITTSAGDYTLIPVFENPNYFTATPSSITVSFPTQISPQTQNFCISPNGSHPDLEVTIVPVNAARPGFDAKYKLVYKNKGTQMQSGSVNLQFDDAVLNLQTAIPMPDNQPVNNLHWNFTNLRPHETRSISITLKVNSPVQTPAVHSGDILPYVASVTSALTDEQPDDNTFNFNQTVVNSYDPNDKTCLEGAMISSAKVGDYVHYVIRFENNGSYFAQNISVKDIIDTSKYDIDSLVPTDGSHPFIIRVSNGNTVEFYFENIQLPHADNENDGYVSFKIKTKSTLNPGDSFSNSAAIYFDYNAAIITNTATTTVQVLAVDAFEEQKFVIYPNPVKDKITIESALNFAISSISVYNTLGQLVMVVPRPISKTIDVSGLKAGNYILKVTSENNTTASKFIKL